MEHKAAFRCKNCGRIVSGADAGELATPTSCPVCNAGVPSDGGGGTAHSVTASDTPSATTVAMAIAVASSTSYRVVLLTGRDDTAVLLSGRDDAAVLLTGREDRDSDGTGS